MSDPAMEAIRQKRMAELAAQHGGRIPQSKEEAEVEQGKQRDAEEQRSTMLASVLRPEARERLSRIALVKPDKARGVENMVLAMAQRGQINEQVSDAQLLSLLEKVNEQSAPKATTTFPV